MRKIIVFVLIMALIVALAVPAFAVTPKWEYKSVKLPQIKPDTSFVQGAVSKWLKTNPIEMPDLKISFTSKTLG